MRSDEPSAHGPAGRFAPYEATTVPRWARYTGGAALVACCAVLGYAMSRRGSAPPPASGSVTAACAVPGFSFRVHAFYASDGRTWKISHFLYRITADGRGNAFTGVHRGAFNNVEISVVSDGERIAPKIHDDDQGPGALVRVPTGTTADRSKVTAVHFHVVFDETVGLLNPFGFDPECAAVTPALPRLP